MKPAIAAAAIRVGERIFAGDNASAHTATSPTEPAQPNDVETVV